MQQQHPLKFLEDLSKGYCVLWKDRGPNPEVLRQYLIKVRWTLPVTTDYLGGQLSWFFVGQRKGNLHYPPNIFKSSQIYSLCSPLVNTAQKEPRSPGALVLGLCGPTRLPSPTAIALFTPVKAPAPTLKLSLKWPVSLSVCFRTYCLIHCQHSNAQKDWGQCLNRIGARECLEKAQGLSIWAHKYLGKKMHKKHRCIFLDTVLIHSHCKEIGTPPQIVQNYRGLRHDLPHEDYDPHRLNQACHPYSWIRIGPFFSPSKALHSPRWATWIPKWREAPRTHDSQLLPPAQAILECSANQEVRGCSPVLPWLVQQRPGEDRGEETGPRWTRPWWTQMLQKNTHLVLGKNENPTGSWWSQEIVHQLHHCFWTKRSFESVNGGFM